LAGAFLAATFFAGAFFAAAFLLGAFFVAIIHSFSGRVVVETSLDYLLVIFEI
jgi:hypothetical protein